MMMSMSPDLFLEGIDPDSYIFESKSFPSDPHLRPSIGNGHIATVVHNDVVHMNGVYNGHESDCHRAVIPSTINVSVTKVEPPSEFKKIYRLDAGRGIFEDLLQNVDCSIIVRQYAHRTISSLLVVEIEAEIQTNGSSQDITLTLDVSPWKPSPDIDFVDSTSQNIHHKHGVIKEPETPTSGHTPVHVLYDEIPSTLTVRKGQIHTRWVYITAMHTSQDRALADYTLGKELIQSHGLYTSHIQAMRELWTHGRVDIEGNLRLARMTSASLYYILSSLPLKEDPTWPFIGLSPNGLPWGAEGVDYWGHVFWDQATWMFPPILALYPDVAKIMMESRKRTAKEAAQNAIKYKNKGLRYPWESGFTGIEVTPEAIYGEQEIHISGDIAFAILQYWQATGDDASIVSGGLGDVILGIANFWISVLEYSEAKGLYEIKDVMCPDEHHYHVNNSAYTNSVARLALEGAAKVTQLLKLEDRPDYRYMHYATHMYVPFDKDKKYHPEYDGYNSDIMVKQADVILMGFPLMIDMTDDVRKNDLTIYEPKTDPDGPAMTWSMFAIGWLDVGDTARAKLNLHKMFDNVANEFQVWTEVRHGQGAPNFITGMGGFLQSIIFGYGGVRITESSMKLNPVLPPDSTKLCLTGLKYQGSSLDVTVTMETVTVTMTQHPHGATELWICVPNMKLKKSLVLNDPVSYQRQYAYLKKTSE